MFGASVDLIILAATAAFILFKLYSILGQTGEDDELMIKYKKQRAAGEVFKDVTPTVKAAIQEKSKEEILQGFQIKYGAKIASVMDVILKADSEFSEEYFIKGARKVFEMVLKAFTQGDKDALKKLLSDDIYKSFINVVDSRATTNMFDEKVLVSILSSEIIDAELQDNLATIKVKFVSEQINIVKNQQGALVQGDPSKIERIHDTWSFARNLKSSNFNWLITATS